MQTKLPEPAALQRFPLPAPNPQPDSCQLAPARKHRQGKRRRWRSNACGVLSPSTALAAAAPPGERRYLAVGNLHVAAGMAEAPALRDRRLHRGRTGPAAAVGRVHAGSTAGGTGGGPPLNQRWALRRGLAFKLGGVGGGNPCFNRL